MAKSTITGSSKKKRGRPTLYVGSDGKGAPQIGLRLPPPELAAIDTWIMEQPKPRPSRPVAIRRLIELGLTVKERPKQSSSVPAERAKDLAAKVIDSLTPSATNVEEKASRKRRLLKGPEEFREVRVDRASAKVKGPNR